MAEAKEMTRIPEDSSISVSASRTHLSSSTKYTNSFSVASEKLPFDGPNLPGFGI